MRPAIWAKLTRNCVFNVISGKLRWLTAGIFKAICGHHGEEIRAAAGNILAFTAVALPTHGRLSLSPVADFPAVTATIYCHCPYPFDLLIAHRIGKVMAWMSPAAQDGGTIAGGAMGRRTLDRNRKLEGRHIIVTGAASGMGAATARLFAQHGASLALFDMNETALREVAEETSGIARVVDVGDAAQVSAAVEEVGGQMGRLDGVVNAAGVLLMKPIEEITPAEQDRVLRINLGGVANVIRAALPRLQAAGNSTIVNFSSYGAYRPGPGLSIYGASKAGMLAMAQSLINDIGPAVRINSICPGVINTPMNQKRIDSGHLSEERMKNINQLQRKGEPEELAEVALFLSGAESSFMSNAVLEVSGGQLN